MPACLQWCEEDKMRLCVLVPACKFACGLYARDYSVCEARVLCSSLKCVKCGVKHYASPKCQCERKIESLPVNLPEHLRPMSDEALEIVHMHEACRPCPSLYVARAEELGIDAALKFARERYPAPVPKSTYRQWVESCRGNRPSLIEFDSDSD